ncbi:hypothetical protein M1K46_23490 [Fictibacillus sp. WQ 8-8]|uniref:hypothetical protein n=1 Tax=Fictibacillus sp. WQ 8-8 TaxID=2938788 RepID=UPI00210BFC4A|nr:hypothetical protein [Fictibacillus sp. WQ 8-8]MCQ6268545.1 hypothetical protein [Fictibacillus sp. WQ 8-8]
MNKQLGYFIYFSILSILLFWVVYSILGTNEPGICFILCVLTVHFVGEKPMKRLLEKEALFLEKSEEETRKKIR